MPKLKLTYFDFHGGRGEPARLALSIAGIPFEDDRVLGADWARRKPSTPFGSLTRSQIYVSLPALATVTSDGNDDLAVHVTARLQGHGVADLLEREPRSDRHGDRSGDDRIGDPPQLLGAGIEASGCAHTSGRVRAGSDRRDSFGTHPEGQGGFHHLGVE